MTTRTKETTTSVFVLLHYQLLMIELIVLFTQVEGKKNAERNKICKTFPSERKDFWLKYLHSRYVME